MSTPAPIGLMDPTNAGNRIQEWRLRTRRSQSEMAKLLGVSTSAVNRHESGNRGISHAMVMKYAMAFKLPTYALFVKPVPSWADSSTGEREKAAVGNRLRELRQSRQLTLTELAKLADFVPEALQEIENGVWGMTHDEIVALARVFKVPTYQIFTRPVVIDAFDSIDTESYAYTNPDTGNLEMKDSLEGDPGTPYEEYPGGPYGQQITGTAL